jgi:hypothetical protein
MFYSFSPIQSAGSLGGSKRVALSPKQALADHVRLRRYSNAVGANGRWKPSWAVVAAITNEQIHSAGRCRTVHWSMRRVACA